METSMETSTNIDTATIMGGLYGDGIIACKGAFTRDWVAQLGADIAVLFEEALQQPGGALPRGPARYYVEIHPERLRGFQDILMHPWFVAVCTAILGPAWAPPRFPGVQHDDGRRRRRHGPARDRTRHSVG
jgi:hypothetical protein